jgi:hypothetical protein
MARNAGQSPRNGFQSKVVRVSDEAHRRVCEMAKADRRGPGAQTELLIDQAYEQFQANGQRAEDDDRR